MTVDFNKPLEVLTAEGWMPLKKDHIRNIKEEHIGYINIYRDTSVVVEKFYKSRSGFNVFKTLTDANSVGMQDCNYVTTVEVRWKE